MHAIIVKLPDFAPDNQHIKVKSYAGTSWYMPYGNSLMDNVEEAVEDHLVHMLPELHVHSFGELPDGSGYAYIVGVL